jgi:hypothetical protein
MWLFVFYTFTIETNKSLVQIQSDLEKLIYADKKSEIQNTTSSHKRFYGGRLNKTTFKATSNYAFSNSFRPFIRGKVKQTANGHSLQIMMYMHWFVLLFFTFAIIIFDEPLFRWISIPVILAVFNFEVFINKREFIKAIQEKSL